MGVRINYVIGEKIGECIYLGEDRTEKRFDGKKIQLRRFAKFRCKCGKRFVAQISRVKNRVTCSCGCLQKQLVSKRFTTHGSTIHRNVSAEYGSWGSMKQRCLNPKHQHYKDYGGRGIIICKRWINSFENFLEDMGKMPTPKYSLERIDVNGNYEPDNCRWATSKEQAINKRNNVHITHNGETLCLSQWAARIGLTTGALNKRLKVWSVEKSLTTSKQKNGYC